MNKSFSSTFIFLSFFLVLFSFQAIDLPTADIGRHIVNGDIFLHSTEYGISKTELLHTNLFSYTNPSFPFINHHWGSGVIIYLLFNIFGFGGLSLAYFLLIWGAFLFAFLTIKDNVNKSTILLTSIFLIPLIAGRPEVRPEGLSYLFISLFIYILYRYSISKDGIPTNNLLTKIFHKNYNLLWLLPILELIWANTHIYFIFGPFLIGVFLLEALLLKNIQKIKKLFLVLGSSTIAMLLTPYGIKGALYPFFIFQNYGYRIVENQSIHFLENLSFTNPEFLWYKITLFLVISTSVFILIKNRKNFSWSLSIISLTFAVLAYLGIRHIPAFALVSLPLIIYNITTIKQIWREKIDKINEDNKIISLGVVFCIILSLTMFQFSNKLAWNRNFGIGIDSGALAPIEFIKTNAIHGPFMNNYDVGGFMIFGLFPTWKVFVDNRPEAYPKEFFQNTYIPMQEDDTKWQEELVKNKFNAIFFYRLDYTPWAQKFLIARIQDPLWAPVFVDNETIIFLRRSEENKEIIKKYEIPKEIFKTE